MTAAAPRLAFNQGPEMIAVLAAHSSPAESGRVFVDCTGCGLRDEIRVDVLDAVTDEQATEWFEDRGWSVRPTLCPGCLMKGSA